MEVWWRLDWAEMTHAVVIFSVIQDQQSTSACKKCVTVGQWLVWSLAVCTLPLEIHLSVSVRGDLIDPPTSARFFRGTSQVTSGKKPQAVTTWMCCGRNCELYFYVVGPMKDHQSRLPQSLWTPGSWYRGWWARRSSQYFSRFNDVTIDMNTHHGEAKTAM